ncbi:hypothetical protein H634G_07523 [Metarhizium anisopliae BRIP 53293]|uniref:Uncharacterized protein n=1 Tax=Metarhizium anisopliae BRIP 53293 TaxID=1291518 RepID=A0A0D9NTR2_METAN|nr:hypothetical protein H634G_07523 [Metarhizium anisopliae BRIP 53293]
MLKLTAYGVFASFLIDNVQPIPVTSVTLVAGLTINIEQQALDLSLIDLLQAFGITLPAPRNTVSKMVVNKRGNAEDFREEAYTRAGTMTYPKVVERRSIDVYSSLLIRDNLALKAIERINTAHRILGKPELTKKEIGSHGDEYLTGYWNSSMKHGDFWTSDQAISKPNFIKCVYSNRFGFTQSTFHKLYCLANLRIILAWHITGSGNKMTRDLNAHTIHCLEYIRWRELAHTDLNEEPIDTVDYEGIGMY